MCYYRAFNWAPPLYGHLPLILNADGTKLSKRQNDIHIESIRKSGIFPLAVLNYVIHAGGGFDNKGGAYYINSYEELIKQVIILLCRGFTIISKQCIHISYIVSVRCSQNKIEF